jgi:sugar/nucleoside kinase (ribokinase family)
MSQLPLAVVAGHICLDIIPNLDSLQPGEFSLLFKPGRLIEAGQVGLSTGGAVSNTGLALHILGIPTLLMGKLGNDLFGRAVLDILASYSHELADGMLVDSASSTSYTVIINPPGVDRIFLHNPGANKTYRADDIKYEQLTRASLFHFGYPPIMRQMYVAGGHDLVEVFRRARATGVTTSLDMSFPDPASPAGKADWRSILQSTLPFVDVFLPSLEEILFMLHHETYQRLSSQAGLSSFLSLVSPELLSHVSAELLEMGVKIVLLKLGARGAYLHTGVATALQNMGRSQPSDIAAWADRQLWAPCFQAKVAGTTGAGDATIAGFLSGLLRGLPPGQALTAAVAVGACNVEAPDALSGLRPWDETLARVNSGWPRLPLQISSPGWLWDLQDGLWVKKKT